MKPWILYTPLLSCCLAFAQQAAPVPAFEVASIKPAKPMAMNEMRIQMSADDGMLRYSNVSLKDCIRQAYRLKDFQIQGPDWISSERFEIEAKLPDGSSQDQVPAMMQALLAERFKLTFHRDTREHSIYALVVGKGGPKLKPAEIQSPSVDATDKAGNPGPARPPRGAMMMRMGPDGAHLKAPSATLGNLAELISRFSERPILDMTEIKGQYDFELVFTPETVRGMPGGAHRPPPGGGEGGHPPAAGEAPSEKAGSIYDSVQKFGLKLESRKAPVEFLIVDHIEKTPTEN